MRKMIIEIDDDTYDSLLTIANALKIDIQSLATSHISGLSLIKSGLKNKEEDLFEMLSDMCSGYGVTQADIADYLQIAQSSVSFALQNKSKTSTLGKTLKMHGVDNFLIKVYTKSKNKQANDAIDLARKFIGDFKKDDTENMDEMIIYIHKNADEWSNITSIIFSHVYSQSKSLGSDAKSSTFHAFAVIKKMTNEDKSYILNAAKASFPEFCDAIHKIIPKFDR